EILWRICITLSIFLDGDNICPDQSRCPDEFSCLKGFTKYGCCPLAQVKQQRLPP
uniref:Uncharacterized protein n=1 Tax=Periophthalmus magnuspinnatus TaxID=409849 RepID=A0A3B4A3X6_9GOBI